MRRGIRWTMVSVLGLVLALFVASQLGVWTVNLRHVGAYTWASGIGLETTDIVDGIVTYSSWGHPEHYIPSLWSAWNGGELLLPWPRVMPDPDVPPYFWFPWTFTLPVTTAITWLTWRRTRPRRTANRFPVELWRHRVDCLTEQDRTKI
jgi:hypothetical protein